MFHHRGELFLPLGPASKIIPIGKLPASSMTACPSPSRQAVYERWFYPVSFPIQVIGDIRGFLLNIGSLHFPSIWPGKICFLAQRWRLRRRRKMCGWWGGIWYLIIWLTKNRSQPNRSRTFVILRPYDERKAAWWRSSHKDVTNRQLIY